MSEILGSFHPPAVKRSLALGRNSFMVWYKVQAGLGEELRFTHPSKQTAQISWQG